MDLVCRFLSADLRSLLNIICENVATAPCKKKLQKRGKNFLVVRPSYTIRHKYPGPLRTYDGEELCEPRLIRLSDIRPSQVDMILSMCEEQDKMEEKCECEEEEISGKISRETCIETTKENTGRTSRAPSREICRETSRETPEETPGKTFKETPEKTFEEINVKNEEELCKSASAEDLEKYESQIFINLLPQPKSSLTLQSICSAKLPTQEQLIRMELRARTLYEVATCQDPFAPTWDCLKSTEKLRFHWQAHTGVKLKATPFDNFRQCYLKYRPKKGPKMGIRAIRSEMKLRWCHMDRSQRMPFIVQALLYQVSVGAINPRTHCVVREFFMKVK